MNEGSEMKDGPRNMGLMPLKSLEYLKTHSPSRKHGVSEEQEQQWKRSCVNLIIKTGLKIQICRDHVATITALEFLHRFYAEYSMVTNDRFLISLACLYLAGKVADSPKSSRDIIVSGLSCVEPSKEAFVEKVSNREWVDAARQQLTKAERAILYQTGFRFGKMTVTEAVIHMLQDKPLLPFLKSTFTDEEKLSNFSQLCIHFSNQSAKIPLVVQYKAETIAGACIWMTLKLFKIDDASLRDPRPWYCKYKITHDALKDISNQIVQGAVDDAQSLEEMANDATKQT